MGFKDWKKTKTSKKVNVWFRKDGKLAISVEKSEFIKSYLVHFGNPKGFANTKQFKTKQIAMRFAKAYMKRN